MIKILLVEDDKIIVASLSEYLNSEGYLVRSVSGQAEAMKLLAEEKADLVLLDVSLAEGNGFAACRAIKAEFDVPVIFLTASGDEFSTVTGFDLGADDYIPKPFRPRELISRIRNVLRLTGSMGKTVKLGDVVVDTEKGTAVKNSRDLFLSALEYRLLLFFINNRGIVLTRERLLDAIWDVAGEYVNDNVEIDGYYRKDSRIDENGNKVVLYQNRDNENDIIELPYEESFAKYTLRSEKTIEEAPFFVSRSTPVAINMIYPYSMLESVVPEAALNQFRNTEYFLTSSDHTASFENLAPVLTENGLSSRQLFDYAANAETDRNVVTIIRVFAYGFIVLISLIAAANVFNTISTNISLRRREFAMLKSVGMTQKGFRRMMNYECLLYGSKALLLGLPVSCGITYLIYRAVTTAYETSFHLPWAAIGIAVLSVFLVVFATMMYSMSKIKKDNPIDALKNENL